MKPVLARFGFARFLLVKATPAPTSKDRAPVPIRVHIHKGSPLSALRRLIVSPLPFVRVPVERDDELLVPFASEVI